MTGLDDKVGHHFVEDADGLGVGVDLCYVGSRGVEGDVGSGRIGAVEGGRVSEIGEGVRMGIGDIRMDRDAGTVEKSAEVFCEVEVGFEARGPRAWFHTAAVEAVVALTSDVKAGSWMCRGGKSSHRYFA